MDLSKIQKVYLIGIGGVGMSALARYFKYLQKQVGGYDRTKTQLTRALESEGIPVTYQDSPDTLPSNLSLHDSLIIYTPAIDGSNLQRNQLQKQGFQLYKRSEVLGIITRSSFCIAVSGTHGKTTTTCLLGHILYENNIKATTFAGGICENYQSNLILSGNRYMVVEADEFDRSFLKLSPDLIIITSMDADHLDIYGEHAQLNKSFEAFARKLPKTGVLITRKGLSVQGITYAADEKAMVCATNITIKDGTFLFDISYSGKLYRKFELTLPGRYNIENTLAAVIAAKTIGLSFEQIRKSIKTFKGIKRRFSVHYKKQRVYIDDYAHHPKELDALIKTIRELFPSKKLLMVFQPHLYSRTRDFADDFAQSLSQVDQLILLDIYPARELPIEGVTAEWLRSKISLKNVQISSLENALNQIKTTNFEVLITAGAGNIDSLINPIKRWLNEK